MSRINPLFGSRPTKKGAPRQAERPLWALQPADQSVVIRECCLVSFMVTYTSSEHAMQAVTYQ